LCNVPFDGGDLKVRAAFESWIAHDAAMPGAEVAERIDGSVNSPVEKVCVWDRRLSLDGDGFGDFVAIL